MLQALNVRSVALLTNNPSKLTSLEFNGVRVTRRVPMRVTVNVHNEAYLVTKNIRMGHQIPSVAEANGGSNPVDGPLDGLAERSAGRDYGG
jgi:hypothetical protein